MFRIMKSIVDWLLGGTGSLDRLANAIATTGGENY